MLICYEIQLTYATKLAWIITLFTVLCTKSLLILNQETWKTSFKLSPNRKEKKKVGFYNTFQEFDTTKQSMQMHTKGVIRYQKQI